MYLINTSIVSFILLFIWYVIDFAKGEIAIEFSILTFIFWLVFGVLSYWKLIL